VHYSRAIPSEATADKEQVKKKPSLCCPHSSQSAHAPSYEDQKGKNASTVEVAVILPHVEHQDKIQALGDVNSREEEEERSGNQGGQAQAIE
jgi:hypothetical protein